MNNWHNLGINYGQHYQSGLFYSEINVQRDLDQIWAMGIRKIRIGNGDLSHSYPMAAFQASRLQTMLSIARLAKGMGFYVMFVFTTTAMNDSRWPNYELNAADVCDLLWDGGNPIVDEVQIGNEVEINIDGTFTDLIGKFKALATTIKASHFLADDATTFISYATPYPHHSSWKTAGRGPFSSITVNIYSINAGNSIFETEINGLVASFGREHVAITEWNMSSSWPMGSTSEEEECRQIHKRLTILKNVDIPSYFFGTFRWDQSSDIFGLYVSSTNRYRKWLNVICGRPPIDLTIWRRPCITIDKFAFDANNTARRLRRTGLAYTGVMTSTAWTLILILKPKSSSGTQNIYHESSSVTNHTFVIQQSGLELLVFLRNSAGTKIASLPTSDSPLRLNKWNSVVFRCNNGSVNVLVNNIRGVRNMNFANTGTYDSIDRVALGIESNPSNNFNQFVGEIGEVCVVPEYLSDEESTKVYQRMEMALGKTKNVHVKFTEGSGTTVADSSGNGQNFTLASSTGAWVTRKKEMVVRSPISRGNQPVTRSTANISRPAYPSQSYRVKWSGLAMNIGQDYQSTTMNAGEITEVTQDLQRIWNMGIRKVRVQMSAYDYAPGVNNAKTIALIAKGMGFYVVFGVTPGFGITDANWSAYVAAVPAFALWAESNGMDEYQIGNEVEYRETGGVVYLSDSVAKLKALATVVKSTFVTGTRPLISYAAAQSSMEFDATALAGAGQDTYDVLNKGWLAVGLGDLDLLMYNAYGDNNLTQAQAFTQWQGRVTDLYNAFGTQLQIGEWNVGDGTARPATDSEQTDEIAARLEFLHNLGIETAYFFTYRWDDGGTETKWALRVNGTYRGWITALCDPL